MLNGGTVTSENVATESAQIKLWQKYNKQEKHVS